MAKLTHSRPKAVHKCSGILEVIFRRSNQFNILYCIYDVTLCLPITKLYLRNMRLLDQKRKWGHNNRVLPYFTSKVVFLSLMLYMVITLLYIRKTFSLKLMPLYFSIKPFNKYYIFVLQSYYNKNVHDDPCHDKNNRANIKNHKNAQNFM